MKSEFRFTRQGLRSRYDVTVRLVAGQANEFSARLDPTLSTAIAPSNLQAVLLGVHSAYAAAALEVPLAVTIVDVIDHSGETGELGFKTCGEGAMYHLLELPEKAPFPGHAPGEA